ncbi:hypothetical protein [Prevotella pallens]|uniref:hypothetical protein n=1 Tax=Prevotella pallens TaxID=60133 RepID=UPI001CAC6CF8|nr:hypothetical protein [Prevotella pallens]MBF1504541.1 hypothetical protein [Prevotella pallens]
MKCLFYIMVVLMLPLLAIRCTQKDDDYYTQAMVTLQVPDTITPIEMQGTVVLKNLSNGRSYTVSTFQENTATINVLRGAYMMDAEGTIRYRMADGTEGVKYYRASKNYIEIVAHPTQIRTNILFM